MKRLIFAFALIAVLFVAGAAWAESDEITADWQTMLQVSGYVDIRPTFYWFTPDNSNLDEEHSSDIVIYETGLGLKFQPLKALRGKVSMTYGEWNQNKRRYLPVESEDEEPVLNNAQSNQGNGEFAVDEAYFLLGGDSDNFPWPYLKTGKYYVGISSKDTFGMHYNLLQRNLFINPVAVGLGLNHKYVHFSANMWNGSNDLYNSSATRADNEIIDTYAVTLNFYPLAFLNDHSIDLGGYLLTDSTETWGDFGQYFAEGSSYSENVMLYGGYLIGRFTIPDLFKICVRGEYATTGQFDEKNYVDAAGEETGISFMNAELGFDVWEGTFLLGGKYENISGVNYFGITGGDYEPTSYSRYGGFLRTRLMDEMAIGFEYLYGSDDENNSDMEFQVQTRLDF